MKNYGTIGTFMIKAKSIFFFLSSSLTAISTNSHCSSISHRTAADLQCISNRCHLTGNASNPRTQLEVLAHAAAASHCAHSALAERMRQLLDVQHTLLPTLTARAAAHACCARSCCSWLLAACFWNFRPPFPLIWHPWLFSVDLQIS